MSQETDFFYILHSNVCVSVYVIHKIDWQKYS